MVSRGFSLTFNMPNCLKDYQGCINISYLIQRWQFKSSWINELISGFDNSLRDGLRVLPYEVWELNSSVAETMFLDRFQMQIIWLSQKFQYMPGINPTCAL